MKAWRDALAIVSLILAQLPPWYLAAAAALMARSFSRTALTMAARIEYLHGLPKAIALALGIGMLASIAAWKGLRRRDCA